MNTHKTVFMLKDSPPSSMFSLAHDVPLRTVVLRNAMELNFELPRYLEELLFPFPDTPVVLAFTFTLASLASLVLRRSPESENNLPEI